MSEIAVTGGAGFIGTAVRQRLESEGHTVKVIDRKTGIDICSPKELFAAIRGCESVIHLAGVLGTSELFDDIDRAIDVNITGTLNVLRACDTASAGYVGITMHEHFPSVYTATKIAAQRLGSAFHNAYGLPVCHVRAYNAYGPGQAYGPGHPRKILPAFSVEAWSQKPITIWGDGTQTVDLIHTDELARILCEATQFDDDGIIDAGTGIAYQVRDIADMVLRVTGSTAGVQFLPMRQGETPTHVCAKGEGWDRLTEKPSGLDMANRIRETVLSYCTHPEVKRAA